MAYFPDRKAKTTLLCPHCHKEMEIARDCHNVVMRCNECRKVYPLKDYIAHADAAMENFLDNVYCDRI